MRGTDGMDKARTLLESIRSLLTSSNSACLNIGLTCVRPYILDPNHRPLLEQSGVLKVLYDLCQNRNLDKEVWTNLCVTMQPFAMPEVQATPFLDCQANEFLNAAPANTMNAF